MRTNAAPQILTLTGFRVDDEEDEDEDDNCRLRRE